MIKFDTVLLFFLTILMLPLTAFSIILDKLVRHRKKRDFFQNHTIGYYIASFDQSHQDHGAIVKYLIKNNVCQYVIVCPSWVADISQDPDELDIRLEELFAVFKENPRVSVTKLPPKALQEFLAKAAVNHLRYRKKKHLATKLVGILGSDIALELDANKKISQLFMSDKDIDQNHDKSRVDGIALPVGSFIVFLRWQDDISVLNGRLGGRPIEVLAIE